MGIFSSEFLKESRCTIACATLRWPRGSLIKANALLRCGRIVARRVTGRLNRQRNLSLTQFVLGLSKLSTLMVGGHLCDIET
jgi:hypothetical protein